MSTSLGSGLGEMFKVPDERIIKAVEKAGNRCYEYYYTLLYCKHSIPYPVQIQSILYFSTFIAITFYHRWMTRSVPPTGTEYYDGDGNNNTYCCKNIVVLYAKLNNTSYICMYGHTYSKSMDQPGKVANPARGQLNSENEYY